MPQIYRRKHVNGIRIQIHRAAAEKAIGRPLPLKHPVHHHDEDKMNNANNNLVICEDLAYHQLLHMRARCLRAGFDPNKFKFCGTCNTGKLPADFSLSAKSQDGLFSVCKDCDKARCRRYKSALTPEQKKAKARRRRERESDPIKRQAIASYVKQYRLDHPRKGH